MKVAILYKGIFLRQSLEKYSEKNFLVYAKEIINNHKSMLINSFVEDEVDFYFSTYKLNEELDNLYKEELSPKSYSYISNHFYNGCCWNAQLMHYKNLISIIKSQSIDYDFFIFTRPDIKFLKKIIDLNVNFSKFNIVHEHPSKNCDDNFWAFPNVYFDSFEKSINALYSGNRITHEINHELSKNNVNINYITPYDFDSKILGHNIFEICR